MGDHDICHSLAGNLNHFQRFWEGKMSEFKKAVEKKGHL
jgi:hypothetical protein